MVTRIIFTILIISFKINILSACLNYYVINEHGEHSIYDSYAPDFRVPSNFTSNKKKLKKLEEKIKSGDNEYWYVSDYTALLVEMGRQKEAIPIILELLNNEPREYNLLSNLAVAYELNGQTNKASEYLEKALNINPESHFKSEWIHKQILEAYKKKIDSSSNLKSILELSDSIPFQTGVQISYQLEERISLTKKKDYILSKTIEDAGDFFKKNIAVNWALEFYIVSIAYSRNQEDKQRLWSKIENCRNTILRLSDSNPKAKNIFNKRHNKFRNLKKKNWTKKIAKDLEKWELHFGAFDNNFPILEMNVLFN